MHIVAQKGHKDIVEFLTAQGADMNAKVRGLQPFHIAVIQGHAQVVKHFIEYYGEEGKNINVQLTDKGFTALDLARKARPVNEEIKVMLIAAGVKRKKDFVPNAFFRMLRYISNITIGLSPSVTINPNPNRN
ncbi:MAG: ankyrin repeat domain-containing protein [Cytophagales bacterium]|nr:ankyrin repeat domain-containing protein [Cytophagales bacterium]